MTQDKLDRIFDLQKQLDDRIGNSGLCNYPYVSVESKSFMLMTAIIHEAIELQRLINWKWWKKPSDFNRDEARKELIDIIHFVVSAAITLGMTTEDILTEYERKNKINHERQENGY